jgi:hypothetical protein
MGFRGRQIDIVRFGSMVKGMIEEAEDKL